MRHPGDVKGFVLLEVLLAAAIGGLVFLVLMNGFSLVTRGYRRITSASDARARLFAGLLGEDLRSAYKEDSPKGEDREAVFSFSARPAEACFVRTRPLGRRREVDVADGLIRVCYGWSSSSAGGGQLTRRVVGQTAGPGSPDPSTPFGRSGFRPKGTEKGAAGLNEERVVLTGLTAMRWDYHDGMQWLTAWDSAERLPRLVRVVFSIVRERGRPENYEMVFDIPGA